MAPLAVAEPMNATTDHSKIRVSIILPMQSVVAGSYVTGKMEVECKSDKLGIGVIMVELFAFQELTSPDYSARMTFLHSRRLFQGPYLPPSNAVDPHPPPGDIPLPEHYYKAKRGRSTFLFRIPLPLSSPASINFVDGLARVCYEVRGSVGVFWKDERQLVTDKDEVTVLETCEEGFGLGSRVKAEEGAIVVGESGRFWVHGRLIGGVLIAGESACVELQVKNHSNRKNTGLLLSLNRTLLLPSTRPDSGSPPLQLSDTILTVPFEGLEYTLPPGGEGVAHLVFDVPLTAKGVRGGTYERDADEAGQVSEALFTLQATIQVKVVMGLGGKDFALEIPITIVHPDVLAELPPQRPSFAPEPIVNPRYASSPEQQNRMRPLPQPTIPLYVDSYIQQARVDPALYQYHLAQESDSPHIPRSSYETTLQPVPQQGFTRLDFPPRQLPLRPSSPSSLSFSPVASQGGGCTPPVSGLPITTSETHTVILPLPALHPYPQTSTQLSVYTPSIPSHYDNRVQNQGSSSRNSPQVLFELQEERREKEKRGITCISPSLRYTSVLTGRGATESPVGQQYVCPLVNDGTIVDIGGAYPLIDAGGVINVVMDPAAVATSHSITPTVNNGVDLLSLLPKSRNKSLTSLNMNAEAVVKSDDILQVEKADIMSDERPPEAGIGKGKEKPSEEIDMNKTFPTPLPVTKSCVIDRINGFNVDNTFIESTMIPLSPLPSQDSSQGIVPSVPPTPTLVACKRPSRLPIVPTNPCGGMEGGLDVLEGQFTAQMGRNGKKWDVCDDLPGDIGPPILFNTRSLRGKPLTKTESSAPSSSTTPNFEDKIGQSGAGSASSERMLPDESAISSLTLDQSSVGDVDGDRYREGIREHRVKETRNDDDDEQGQEQESVDGGKTHKAGKSIVEAQSYLQSRHQYSQQCESTSVESYNFSPIASPGDTKPPVTALQIASTDLVQKKGLNKLKKSAQTRGRVTAWLGQIDPDAPPPQEEIIPPSPSVARAVEWDLLDVTEKMGYVVGDFDLRTRSCLRTHSFSRSPSSPPVSAQLLTSTPLCSSVHLETDEATTLSFAATTSPDPRSSGFMSIEKLEAQRDTITNSMSKSALLRAGGLLKKATVVKQARRALDGWVEPPQDSRSVRPVLPQALDPSTVVARSNHKKEVKGKEREYLFSSPKSIKVDQKNSLLSANTGIQNSSKPVVEPQSVAVSPPTVDDKRMTPRSTSSPASYANVVSRTRLSDAHVIYHGPLKRNGRSPVFPSPQEIQNGIEFKRGGGGSAIVATGDAARGVKPGVVTSDGSAAIKRLTTRDVPASALSGASSSKRPESPVIFGFPLSPNGPGTNDLQSLSSSKLKQLRTISKPKTSSFVNKFKSRPSLLTRPFNNMKAAPRSDSIQKSTFVLAQAFSSPTSSSTVSPIHPSGRASSQITAAVVGFPGIGRGDYKSTVLGNVEGGQLNASVKHSSAVKKMFGRGIVDGENVERTYLDIKRVPTKSNARHSMVSTTIVDVNATKPYATSSSIGKGHVKQPSSNDMVLGQGRLRKLAKKY